MTGSNHTPSAVLRNHIRDLLGYYWDEVDNNIDRSKDVNNTTHSDALVLSPSLLEKGQENQEEVIQCTQSESEQIPPFIRNFVLEVIISRYGAKKNYNTINEQQLQMQSRTKELSLPVSVDILHKADYLAKKTMILIDMFDGIYEVAK